MESRELLKLKLLIQRAVREKIDNLRHESRELKDTIISDRPNLKSPVIKLQQEIKEEIGEYVLILDAIKKTK